MRAVLVVLALLAVPRGAEASRTNYGWLFGSEVLPERGVELQTWVWERNGLTNADIKETLLWWGALVGVTDQLELVFPVEFLWLRPDNPPMGTASETTFTLEKFGIEARYRFVKQDLENPDGVAPLVRIAAKRNVSVRDLVSIEGNFVASYQAGPFHAQVDLGAVANFTEEEVQVELRPGVGISFEVKDDLRLGAELYSELPLDNDLKQSRWIGVGPNISWTHGRFWISGSFLIGLHQITTAPRFLWGILF